TRRIRGETRATRTPRATTKKIPSQARGKEPPCRTERGLQRLPIRIGLLLAHARRDSLRAGRADAFHGKRVEARWIMDGPGHGNLLSGCRAAGQAAGRPAPG